ncbi:MAG: DNA polymerase III subunit delta [Saprospiraceae bacterium]
MDFKTILSDLKKKDFKPVYFLHGDEPYYIDQISDYIESKALTEAEQSFNQTVFYGKEAEPKTVIDTCSRYPMMAQHQVVMIKEAQEMKRLVDLELYINKPVPSTILVVCFKHKKFDGRTKFAKAIKANALVFESKKLYDNQVPDWIKNYLKQRKLTIEPQANELIAEYLGSNLSKVANELDKMIINLPKGANVTPKHVQDNIGISKDYNVFELQNALGTRNIAKANRIINYFIANEKKNPLVVVIATLYGYFSKIYQAHFLQGLSDNEMASALGTRSFFVKDYKAARKMYSLGKTESVISILSEYDLKSKGVDNPSTPPSELLREMVWRILH